MNSFSPFDQSRRILTMLSGLCWLGLSFNFISCVTKTIDPPYQDLSHSSKVFKHSKAYRLYLPENYSTSSTRYPVIYFFHGWGGRHFKDDNAKLEYEQIKTLVDRYQVILVMWDGNITEDQPRPYNIGNHENIDSDVQMPEYFIELKDHIDSTYRTITDRGHRGIIGFSMGGFLSYFIAGKYPDLINAAVNMTGSPEFFVGYPDNHTLYPLRYTFKNLREVHLRFHNSTADELTDLNKEVQQGALWEGGLSYDYWVFEGGHKVDDPGKTDVFEKAMQFVVKSFDQPRPKPAAWWHYDIYPEFTVWDYKVKTTKKEPGFIYLKHVTAHGFGIKTHQWLPAGPPISEVEREVFSSPAYIPNTAYQTIQYRLKDKDLVRQKINSDSSGRLHFPLANQDYEMGIYRDGDRPEYIVVDYTLGSNRRFLLTGQENKLSLQLFNRGGESLKSHKLKIKITSRDTAVRLIEDNLTIVLDQDSRLLNSPPFKILSSKKPPLDGAPSELKFNIDLELDSLHFEDEVIVPVWYDVPVVDQFSVDDGRKVNDSAEISGKGNGNGVINPGEQIMIYVNGHRTRIYTDDPYVVSSKEKLKDEALPAKWPDGFTLTSVLTIDPACPDGHRIECLFNYETKSFMPVTRKLTWGKLWIEVKNSGGSKAVPSN